MIKKLMTVSKSLNLDNYLNFWIFKKKKISSKSLEKADSNGIRNAKIEIIFIQLKLDKVWVSFFWRQSVLLPLGILLLIER